MEASASRKMRLRNSIAVFWAGLHPSSTQAEPPSRHKGHNHRHTQRCMNSHEQPQSLCQAQMEKAQSPGHGCYLGQPSLYQPTHTPRSYCKCQPRSSTQERQQEIHPLLWLLTSILCQSVINQRSQLASPSKPCTHIVKNIPPFCSCQLSARGSSALLHFLSQPHAILR